MRTKKCNAHFFSNVGSATGVRAHTESSTKSCSVTDLVLFFLMHAKYRTAWHNFIRAMEREGAGFPVPR